MSDLNYTTYVSQISNLMVIGSTDANFQTMLPGMIDYAEQRMYRELDLLATRITDASATVSSGYRNFALPTTTGTFLVVEGINTITPVTLTASSSGSRNPVVFTSREFIDVCYPSNSVTTGVPEFAAMIDNANVIFGPAPDAAYYAEVIGTQRPTALSSGNSSTILTQMLPDVFVAASMVFGSGYMRNFGSQADNPQMAMSWEQTYKTLFASAQIEEVRKMYRSGAWSPMQPSPVATPSRV